MTWAYFLSLHHLSQMNGGEGTRNKPKSHLVPTNGGEGKGLSQMNGGEGRSLTSLTGQTVDYFGYL